MDYFPIFLNLQGRSALVVGGTEAAAHKTRLLLRAGARVTVVDPAPQVAMAALLQAPLVEHERRRFKAPDLDGRQIVIASSDDPDQDARVARLAAARGLPVNVVDRPELCSFIMPSLVDRSPLMVAVSSGGASPVLARLIRARIEALLPAGIGALAGLAQAFRAQVMARIGAFGRRRFWEDLLEGEVADLAAAGRLDDAAASLQGALDRAAGPGGQAARGEVWLVGAGPGDPDLLTQKAARLMQRCDVVLHDRLVPPAILDRVRRDAEIIEVGKSPGRQGWTQEQIHRLMIARAGRGQRVLRLKGGDPFVFGRAGEEVAALTDAGVRVLVVPGITAAQGAAAEHRLPLTQRGRSRACVLLTADTIDGFDPATWRALAGSGATLAVYMGARTWPLLRRTLLESGMAPETPVHLCTDATRPQSRIVRARLGDRALATARLAAPTLILIGSSAPCDAAGAAAQADAQELCPLSAS